MIGISQGTCLLVALSWVLSQRPGNNARQTCQQVIAQLARWLNGSKQIHAGNFVVGSACLRLADEPGADSARERQHARQHLERAETLRVAEDDRPKLQYRLGKVWLLAVSPKSGAKTGVC